MKKELIYNGIEFHYISEMTQILDYLLEGHKLVFVKEDDITVSYIEFHSLKVKLEYLGESVGVASGASYRGVLVCR